MRMSLLKGRPGLAGIVAGFAAIASTGIDAPAQSDLTDGRFEELRKASVVWERRTGPERVVLDQVCLVPDLPTFLDAVAAWDDRHFFPVLIDDVESTFKFLRAFKPARVVRLPAKAAAVPPAQLWDRAREAVGRAWTAEPASVDGSTVPKALGATPPGVVVSEPDSPTLAGAVALAAGRFQPLLRWDVGKSFDDELQLEEARDLARNLVAKVRESVPRYDRLGDDCDFVTLAGDYPYRYIDKEQGGACAFDDLILRDASTRRRWAFAGRLVGDAPAGVYAAMCALFLKPSAALLFNTYSDASPPWSEYAMSDAASRLNRVLPSAHHRGVSAALAGWHQTFDPVNRYGLVLLNTHGSASTFNPGGQTADTPQTSPTALLIIHSFSAESPRDPQTIAGRWLANGAFVYFGSMNEPYLQAFRSPTLVAGCLAENFPVSAAVRRLDFEPFGQPWRLVYFGDPLYRVRPLGSAEARSQDWGATSAWPVYGEYRQPAAGDPESVRLNWALKTAIFRLQTGAKPQEKSDVIGVLLGTARDRLDPPLRPVYDALLTDALTNAARVGELLDRLTNVPKSDRSPDLKRHLETLQAAALQRAMASKDFRQALALWRDVARAPGSRDFVRVFTERVGTLADTPVKLADWSSRLRAALKDGAEPSNAGDIEAELKRTLDKLKPKAGG